MNIHSSAQSQRCSLELPHPLPHRGIIGHRGGALQAPENTAAALYSAAHSGLNWVEVDVQALSDGHFVIFHDASLDRTTSAKGLLYSHDAKSLDPHWGILSLEQCLKLCLELELTPNLEWKITHPSQEKYLFDFYQYVKQFYRKQQEPGVWPLISSFEHSALEQLRHWDADLWLGYLWDEDCPPIHLQPTQKEKTCFHYSAKDLSPEKLATWPDPTQRSPVLIYTVNDREKARSYLRAGAYAVFSDDAEL